LRLSQLGGPGPRIYIPPEHTDTAFFSVSKHIEKELMLIHKLVKSDTSTGTQHLKLKTDNEKTGKIKKKKSILSM
jgi:hypothetical protein